MKLTIVIPALNEEDAIGSTIERCLAAREMIVEHSPVDEVEIIVVSDGSTDRTAQVAEGYGDVQLIVFEQNQGYGAAIKEGFRRGSGEIVGFLDADGTCDPRFFSELCTALVSRQAAVALGSRLGPQSKMPRVRRIGNRAYALILSVLSNRPVTDTASGMRVIRRDALERLYPLPNGLNFTPAMSARALMDDRLKIVELPMAYEERVGESKLHVLRDGVRFLRTIFEMTLMWKPAKPFLFLSGVCLALMALLAMHPIEMWLRAGSLEEGMIYRLLFCSLMGTLGVTLLSAAVLSDLLHLLVADTPANRTYAAVVLDKLYTFTGLGLQCVVTVPLFVWLVGPGLLTRVTEGHIYLHWSRVVLAGLIVFSLGQSLVTVLIANIVRFHTARENVGRSGIAQEAAALRSSVSAPSLHRESEIPASPITVH